MSVCMKTESQSRQPLVMHSFLTSNSLPLGFEAQHRMCEGRDKGRDNKEEKTILQKNMKFDICVKEKRGRRKWIFQDAAKRRKRKKGAELRK